MAAFEALISLGLFVAYLLAIPMLRLLEPQRVYLIGAVGAGLATLLLLPLLSLRREAVAPEAEPMMKAAAWESRVE